MITIYSLWLFQSTLSFFLSGVSILIYILFVLVLVDVSLRMCQVDLAAMMPELLVLYWYLCKQLCGLCVYRYIFTLSTHRAIVVLVTYFIVGAITLKFKFEKSGTDIIPQKAFWFALPFMVKVTSLHTFSIMRHWYFVHIHVRAYTTCMLCVNHLLNNILMIFILGWISLHFYSNYKIIQERFSRS